MENVTVTEYRELPVNQLVESITNPRRTFEESALKEMAETVRTKGIFQPLLVRPRAEGHFEVVFGARRFRAAKLAEAATVPVRIREMSDTEVLEAQLVELSIVVKCFLSVLAGLHVVDVSTTCGFAS